VFRDEAAESVMLGLQLVHAARLFKPYADERGDRATAAWCAQVIDELTAICNGPAVWDGAWYRRLLLSNGMKIGSAQRPQGRIYLEPQVWAVISGVATGERARQCMDSARELLNTERGLMICAPPYTGIPNPTDPLTSNAPGTGENGSVFCHANAWAVIAECILGRGDRAWEYWRKVWPGTLSAEQGQDHWGKEPYVFNSTVVGPARGADFGKAGISWLTGTATWMYVAMSQHLLGVKPTRTGLELRPCLPAGHTPVTVTRQFRGRTHRISITGNVATGS
jgi:cellobiose phosphorylase